MPKWSSDMSQRISSSRTSGDSSNVRPVHSSKKLEPSFRISDFYKKMRSTQFKKPKRISKMEVQAAARIIAPFIYLRSQSAGPKNITTKGKKSFRTIRLTRPSFNIPNISSHLKTTFDLPMLLLDSALTLKKCTKSENMILYLKDDANGEIFQFSTHVVAQSHRVNYKIQPGTTLAAYVAYTKQYVVTEDCLSDARFPFGLGWTTENGPALCTPIITPIGLELFAVIELSRDLKDKPYSKREVEACLNLVGWIGATVQENQDSMLFEKERILYDYLKQLISIYFCQPIELNMFFSELVVSARIALCAQSSAFYTIAHVDDRGDLEMDMYAESGIDKHQRKQWFKLNTSKTVAARVAITGKPLNLSRKELVLNRFNTSIFKPIPCRNILSMPVVYNKRAIGVVELLNKIDGEKFTKTDVDIMNNIILFCNATLSCYTLKEDMRRLLSRLKVRQKMLEYHMEPCIHDLQVFHELNVTIPNDLKKFSFLIDESIPTMNLCFYAHELLLHVMGKAYIEAVNTKKLLLMAAKATPNGIFHNFHHCFSLFHVVFFVLSQYPSLFTLDEKEELLLTALCHGVHNNNMIATSAQVDALPEYSEWKQFKYHETLKYMEIIFKDTGVLPPVVKPVYNEKMNEISQLLLYCYQKDYVQDGKDLVNRLDKKLFKWNHPDDRIRMKRGIMVVATYYLHTKPFIMSVTELMKLYCQLSDEIEGCQDSMINVSGLPIMPNTNENLQKVAVDQIKFLHEVVLPWIYIINLLFPNTAPIYAACLNVLECWKGVLQIEEDVEVWFPDKSIVYKTSKLRDEVMKVLDSLKT
ncbi:cAMP and cAMP-inhibited cGMP 3',5'-cyclic phosphodiesterase 10A-like [Cimex lectularius]|uniref:3',5'-cyclic-GMP phosphodiesterase n=1 Tax=Cimex lectularius TaxID=79782 RepID=A0A8I6RJ50_CIMLE|nr:cAMP and cAMP-inhibited cGMP 3',5'-cyclic phosphodiesterase 10A-like [Cimex lectularius]